MHIKEIRYEVNENGCWNCISHAKTNGYPVIQRGTGKQIKMSRYMYEKYKGKIPEGMVIRHKCDNPSCINPDHLEVGTQKENMHDMCERGRHFHALKRGSDNGFSLLNEKQVAEIKQKLVDGERPVDIAKEYGVSNAVVYHIAHGKTWRHVINKKLDYKKHYGHGDARHMRKSVYQMLGGKIIKRYLSAAEASRETGINAGLICRIARGDPMRHTAGGYGWAFV